MPHKAFKMSPEGSAGSETNVEAITSQSGWSWQSESLTFPDHPPELDPTVAKIEDARHDGVRREIGEHACLNPGRKVVSHCFD